MVDQNIRRPRSPYNITSWVPSIMPPNTNPFQGARISRVFLSKTDAAFVGSKFKTQKGGGGYILAKM